VTTSPQPAWRVVGLHHVAFAHQPGSATEDALGRLLGLEATHSEVGEGFVERMIPVGENCHIQLLEATGEGVVDRFVTKKGSAMHHVAFEVDDIEAAVADLAAAGVRLVDDRPRAGGLGTRIAFIHPADFGGLLVELVESP